MPLNHTLILLSPSTSLDGTSVVINLWITLVQEYKGSFNVTSNHPPTTTFSLQLPPNSITSMPYYYDLPELRPVAPELEVPELIIPSDYCNNKRPLSPTSNCTRYDCSPVKRSRRGMILSLDNTSCYDTADQVYHDMSSSHPTTHGSYPDLSVCLSLELDSVYQAPWRQDQATPTTAPPQETKKPAKKPAKTTQQQRRKRTVFTAEELAILNSYYEINKFLNPGLKAEILEKLDVPGNVLVMWYQNKRANDRANGMII
eukprot:sb/3468519/